MSGFTLLEMLVAITTIVLVMGFASVSYGKFNRKQTLKQASLTLKTYLRSIQFRAINGQKPLGVSCDQLDGYTITFASASYAYTASCTPVQSDAPIETITLPSGVTFSPVPSTILYKVLGLGTDKTALVNVSMINGTETYLLQIYPNGEIVDGGFQ